MERSLTKGRILFENSDDLPEPNSMKIEYDDSESSRDVAANTKHEIDTNVVVGDKKEAVRPRSRPVNCPTCGATYPTATALGRHLVASHLSDCETCAEVYRDGRLLRRHLAESHGVPARRRKRKAEARRKRKGIDSDPFMRCFLREVDAAGGSEGATPEQRDDDGSVLYLYPVVEYRAGQEVFYRGGGGDETTSSDEPFPPPKVFLYDPGSEGDETPPESVRCEVCLGEFESAVELARHVETAHAALLGHRCDLCDRRFLGEDELFVHVDRDPHACLLCSEVFADTLSLRKHLLGHSGDRRVVELFS